MHALVLAGFLSSAACPDCAIGREARTAIFGEDFAQNLSFAILPFLVIGAICLGVDRIGRE